VKNLRQQKFTIIALEQNKQALPIYDFKVPLKVAILVGNEVTGIEESVLSLADAIVEIPMLGQKESLNVVQASAMVLYHCRLVAKKN
jgi:tRNA G18 (ribose-2'-O)-methylase SpoU